MALTSASVVHAARGPSPLTVRLIVGHGAGVSEEPRPGRPMLQELEEAARALDRALTGSGGLLIVRKIANPVGGPDKHRLPVGSGIAVRSVNAMPFSQGLARVTWSVASLVRVRFVSSRSMVAHSTPMIPATPRSALAWRSATGSRW
jgi:hypothetical protein